MDYDDGDRIKSLTELQCWELVESEDLARLAVSVDDRPDIFPVTYVSHGGKLYVRTTQGSKLLELAINNQVAVEIDKVQEDSATSVVMHGQARRLESEAEILAAEKLPLRTRRQITSPVYIEITPSDVNGRWFDFSPAEAG
ncbi:pyridoxamine 5'-phosphate oxidase family protein [Georgenia yuyongxinii]|uniref:Pyridoxamine 5'-phosphate oxidase family protein n=1 Tax=Georgenia yuyongxinii TaxID=2589797 RepID=A0A5B8CAC9_9MICO|nr:pyridoxamine 5'-phosphate oxidase family protein [Georgenia yuyongxinii]QDC25036.1 pyridoxamine 5'-phosphate oxidase family protein [Georgenia yuyongxinii]